MQPQSSPAQFYYLVDGQPRGPVDASQIIQMVANGSASPSVMVAQVGWNHWAQAIQVWPNMPLPGAAAKPTTAASAAPPPLPAAAPAPVAEQLAEVPIRCIAGPDMGKMLMI